MDNLTGQQIKGYQLQERIAAGGFGAVYRAYQSTVGREVAIKVILPGLANQPDFIRRFETEAQLIARLEHMNIVPLHDYWRDPDGAYLVMRYLRGGSLHDYIKKNGALSIEDTLNLLSQVAQGLHIAHRNHVIHRDIKPGNILLDEDANGYLADFGIAKDHATAQSITEPDSFIGSPEYLAPEQARSEPVTPQTDIYSLGVILYEMLTGEHPFPNTEKIMTIYKHLNEPLPEVVNLDNRIQNGVNEVIQKATTKDPKGRFNDVIEMMQALRQAAQLDATPSSTSLVELLTPREQEVMQLIIDGKSNREIADILVLAEGSVKQYINNIYRKLKVRSRVQAIARARDLNFVIQKPEFVPSISTGQIPEPDNPYKGLCAFQHADEQDFYGREKLTQKLLTRLQEDVDYQRFLAVVGPSGSGKSSVVKAGLMPALWRGDFPGSDNWYIIDMLPGANPIDELEVALLQIATDKSVNLHEQLERDKRGLIRVASVILPDDGSELLLVIDQFEEVFTLLEHEDERVHFLSLLREAVTDRRSRVRVVVTLRADYYDRPLQYPDFGELIRNRVETVLPLGANELERAIREPATRVGVLFEDGLVSRIASDVHYQPGSLPLLQYALTELFERRDGRKLTLAAYQDIGGTGGALAKRADEIYLEGNDAGQDLIRQLFLRLVTLGEGVEDTRRRVERSELLNIAADSDMMDEKIDLYAASRLLSLDNDPATRRPTVELAHEAILREWDRLRGWLNESRDDIRQQRELAALAAEWQAHKKNDAYLVRESRLERLLLWADDTSLSLTPLERDYLAACNTFELQRQADEQAQAQRLNLLQHQRQRILQVLVAVFAVATVIAGGLGLIAWNSRNAEAEARHDAEIAESEALRQASIGLAALAYEAVQNSIDPMIGVLLALEAVENYPHTSQAVGTLAFAVDQYRERRTFFTSGIINSSASAASWSPDGSRLASGGRGSTTSDSVAIWDVVAGEIAVSTPMFAEVCEEAQFWVYDLVWSADGTMLAGIAKTTESGFGCGIVVIDSTTAIPLLTIEDTGSPARSLDWSSDGTRFVTGHEDGSIRLWDANSGMAISILTGHEGIVHDARISPNNTRIVSASEDGSIRLWDIETGDELMTMWGHAGSVISVSWSPDGLRIVSGGYDTLPRVWDIATGQTLYVLAGHTSPVVSVFWSDNGSRIATHSLDATAKIWDADTGRLFLEIDNVPPSDFTKLGYAELDPTGRWLVTGGGLITGVELWDTASPVPVLFGHSFGQEWGSWSPDGRLIATAGSDGSTRIWDAVTGEQVRDLEAGSFFGSWSPDSTRIVTPIGVETLELAVWNVESGEVLARIVPEDDGLGALGLHYTAWSPDGNYILATGGRSNSPQLILIWDANTYEQLVSISSDDGCNLGWPKWSPDSNQIVAGCWGVAPDEETYVRVWDALSGNLAMRLDNPSEGYTWTTEWSPDGTKLLTTHGGAIMVIWDVATGEPLLTFTENQGFGGQAIWSHDGRSIASYGFGDHQLKIWDANTGEVSMSIPLPSSPYNIAWSPDDTAIMISGDGLIEPLIMRVWRSTDELVAYAYDCCVSRELMPGERNLFGLPER